MGFADGALRLLPGFLEFEFLGVTLSLNLALGSILLLPVVFSLMGAYPFFEAWVTGDKREHHLLDRPHNAPVRTAIGVAAITAYLVMFLAAGNDLMAIKMGLSINDITRWLQVLFFVGPVIAFWVTKRLCLSKQLQDKELALHGTESGRIVQTEDGRFYEVHEPLSEYDRWALVQHESPRPLELGPGEDAHGNPHPDAKKDAKRLKWSRFFFSDRVAPATPAELAEAHSHGHDAHADEAHAEIPSRPGAVSIDRGQGVLNPGDMGGTVRDTDGTDRI